MSRVIYWQAALIVVALNAAAGFVLYPRGGWLWLWCAWALLTPPLVGITVSAMCWRRR